MPKKDKDQPPSYVELLELLAKEIEKGLTEFEGLSLQSPDFSSKRSALKAKIGEYEKQRKWIYRRVRDTIVRSV